MLSSGRLLKTVAGFLPWRSAAAGETTSALGRHISQHRTDRFIAGTRLAFTLCALLAVIVDPSEPPRNAPHVLVLVIAYALYSVVTVGWTWSSTAGLGARVRLGTQATDIGVAVALISLSGGADSPFFPFTVFPLLSASLRWRWRGAVWAGGVSLAAYCGAVLYARLSEGAAVELNSAIIEAVYLVIMTAVLAYLAAHDDHVRREMAAMAAWATSQPADMDHRLRDILEHVANVLEVPRVVLLWRTAEQPRLSLASWTPEHYRSTGEAPVTFEPLVADPLRESDFVCSDAARSGARVVCTTNGSSWHWRGRPLGEELRSAFAIRAVIGARLHGSSLRGRLLALDKQAATSDDLVLAAVVARQVENVIEHDYLDRQLRQAALIQERARLARDVHDGALQSLAGAAIRLETIRRQLEEDPAAAGGALHELQTLIMLQQRELRSLVHDLQTGGTAADSGLADLLTELALGIEQEWKLPVKLVVTPPGNVGAAIQPELAREIYQIIREALVNVARHTLASLVHIVVELESDRVRLSIADNGQGFPFRGRFEHVELDERNAGPVMLRQRIAAIGGTIAIESSDEGARLAIVLPRTDRNSAPATAEPTPDPRPAPPTPRPPSSL